MYLGILELKDEVVSCRLNFVYVGYQTVDVKSTRVYHMLYLMKIIASA